VMTVVWTSLVSAATVLSSTLVTANMATKRGSTMRSVSHMPHSVSMVLSVSLPFDAHCCHIGTAIKDPVPDRFKLSFVIFDIRAL